MKPLISVIIPFYNGENYIEKCLDSVRNQKYPNLEVLIIDDGSKKGSTDIVQEYTKKTKVSIKIIRQENQGQGAARNAGIEQANGKYLCFLDQDDTMEAEVLLEMVDLAEKTNADIVSAGYRRVTKDGKVKQEVILQDTEWSKYKVITPWSKLYLREFITANHIEFLPVVLGEDIYFLMRAYSYQPKIVFWEGIAYHWLDNAVSVSNTAHKELTKETSLLKLYDMLKALDKADVLKADKMYEYFLIKTAVWDILYTARSNSYGNVLVNCSRIWNWFEEYFPEYKKNPYLRITKPKGEGMAVRFIVWGYLLLKRLHLEKLFLRVISR